jgi:hypothetical protein
VSDVPKTWTDDEYGNILNHFVEWIDNNGPKSRNQREEQAQALADGNNLANLIKAQTVTFSNIAQGPWPLGSNNFQPTSSYTNTYFIYAVDAKDQGYDYYIIEQESMLPNGVMYRGKFDNYKAYYLYSYSTDHYLLQAYAGEITEANILQPYPFTAVGSTSSTTSQSYNISGSLGFQGMGGAGSISGGATFSSSHTTNTSDILIQNQAMQRDEGTPGPSTNARWTYQVQNLPEAVPPPVLEPDTVRITDPPTIAVNTALFYNSWIWRVPRLRSSFRMNCYFMPLYAYTYAEATGWWGMKYINNDYYGTWQRNSIDLTPPPRN